MYMFDIIDLYSRYVAGLELSNTMIYEWFEGTLKDAMVHNGNLYIILS